MAKIFFNLPIGKEERAWEVSNGATRTNLVLVNKTGRECKADGYLIASIGFLNKGNHSFLFINPQTGSNDPRTLGVFLNNRCGYRVVSGEELFSASSVGGPGNSESKFGVYSSGTVIASATYKMRDGENFWVLNAVNGWEFIGKDAVLADDEITEL